MRRKRVRNFTDEDTEAVETTDDVVCTGNNIYFYSDVTTVTIMKFVKCLHEATSYSLQNTNCVEVPRVYLYIHSNGGDVFAGMSAMDHIMSNRVPVTTIADGMVASAATFMLLGGTRRLMMRHSFVLIHQLSTGFEGKYKELVDEMQNSTSLMQTIRSIYQERTTMTTKNINKLLNKELVMDSSACIQEGFVHELVSRVAETRPVA